MILNGLFAEANNNVVPGGWYVGALVLLYFLYPAMHKVTKALYEKSKLLVLCLGIGIYSVSKTALFWDEANKLSLLVLNANSFIHQLICLVMGIALVYFMEEYEASLQRYKKSIIVIAVISLVGQITTYYLFTVSERNLVSGFTFSVISIMCYLYYDDIKKHFVCDVLKKIGKNSYEIYFIHFIFVWYIMPMGQKVLLGFTDNGMIQMLYYTLSLCVWIPVIYLLASGYHSVWTGGRNKLLSYRLQRE